MISRSQILTYLSENKTRFRKEYHVVKLGIFGSIARNEQTENSDIDLIVEFEPNTENLFDIKQQLKDDIQSYFKTPVDLCRLKYIKPMFLADIERDARYV